MLSQETRQVHSTGPARTALYSVSRRAVLRGIGSLGASVAGLTLLGGCQFVGGSPSTPTRVRHIGFLYTGSQVTLQPYRDAFLDQLHQHGWIEGENLTVEWRFADGRFELLPGLAAELVRLEVEVLTAIGGFGAVPARQQTSTIPIVMINVGDPVGEGLVQSLVRPGGNVTGVRIGTVAITVKGVELLKTVAPWLARLVILGDPRAPAFPLMPSTASFQ